MRDFKKLTLIFTEGEVEIEDKMGKELIFTKYLPIHQAP